MRESAKAIFLFNWIQDRPRMGRMIIEIVHNHKDVIPIGVDWNIILIQAITINSLRD